MKLADIPRNQWVGKWVRWSGLNYTVPGNDTVGFVTDCSMRTIFILWLGVSNVPWSYSHTMNAEYLEITDEI